MKYEEIKVGDVLRYQDDKETVISKSDEHRFITTIGDDMGYSTWSEKVLHYLKPIKKELPEEGLLVSKAGSLVYRLSGDLGYGFLSGNQSDYSFDDGWDFSSADNWKPAAPEQKKKFVEMLKKECEKRGLFEDTKLTECGINSDIAVSDGDYGVIFKVDVAWNKNGKIFELGKFATPLKEEVPTLELVSKAVKEIGDFTIEQTESGLIILTPINK